MRPRFTLLARAASLSLVCLALVAAQTKPNFSGTWKMNAAKSKFERSGPDSITIKLEQKEAGLSEALVFTNDANERRVEVQYAADGKESDVTMGERTAKGAIKWEGETLVIAWKTGEGSAFTRKLKLSADGKTINMEVLHPNGAVDTIVLEKQ